MLKVSNVKIYDLKESVIASGNTMRLEPVEYTEEEFQKGLERCKKLVNISKTTDVHCHDNFLTGIRVSFDIVYPNYWTPEFQRYHFADIVTSSSKMHRLLKMNLDKACNKYVSKEVIEVVQNKIDIYNKINSIWDKDKIINFKLRNGNVVTAYNIKDALYYAWMEVLSNAPLGLELFMRVSTNYKQLQTIYYQRRNHKLIEDWQEGFIKDFVEKLPYFKEFILGE